MNNSPPDPAAATPLPAPPVATTGSRRNIRQKWANQRRRWLLLVLLLLLPCCLLAWFCAWAASTYCLEIPLQTSSIETALLYFIAPGGDWNGKEYSLANLAPTSQPVPVRLTLRSRQIEHLRVDFAGPTRDFTVGLPVVRCVADICLGAHTHDLPLSVSALEPPDHVETSAQEGDRLRFRLAAEQTSLTVSLRLPHLLSLFFNAPAFWRLFVVAAVGWCLLAGALYLYAGRLLARITPFTTGLLEFRPATAPPAPLWERAAVKAVFVLSAIVQLNAILHHGAMGQDFPFNFGLSVEIVQHPEKPLPYTPTNPPGFEVVNAFFYRLTGGVHSVEVCGLFNASLNLVALWVFYLLARRFLGRPVWRVTLLTLVAFLPLRLIHTVVIAADALTLLPIFTLAWVIAELTDADAGVWRCRLLAVAASLLLVVGLLVKFTFLSAAVAVALTLLQLGRRRRAPWKEVAALSVLALLLPLVVAEIGRRANPDFTGGMCITGRFPNTMSYGDVLFVKKADLHIFKAPPWDEPLDPTERPIYNGKPLTAPGPYELLAPHRYSYPALNHLMIFTDGDNIFQYDPTDSYFGQRSRRNHRLMAVAVATAVPITLLCVACALTLGVSVILQGLFQPLTSRPDLEAALLLALGWFGNLVVFLPFVEGAGPYLAGLWDPRLNMAAFLLFLLLSVYVLDRCLRGRFGAAAAWVSFAYVVFQSCLHVSFLWPWGQM